MVFTNGIETGRECYRCQAEDADHAEEQCRDAEPAADILWVNEGTSIEMN